MGRPAEDLSFEGIHNQNRDRLLRVAFLATGSRAVAEEIVQEAFLRLHERFDSIDNPGGFLRVVVVRLCSHWRDRRASEGVAWRRVNEPPPLGEPAIDTVWEALGSLREERRVALVLRFYEDLDYREIASLLSCSVVTARTRVHRGLSDLRRELPS